MNTSLLPELPPTVEARPVAGVRVVRLPHHPPEERQRVTSGNLANSSRLGTLGL